ncbi:hypothetical protein ACC713_35220 [Rhizobium johnstonii]|uniref:hypothetical protein n=1 Tax=Rhizobium TaxID=379 RepID=UPI00102F5864|nr:MULTISPECIES: hypothetical protein [Rhizobium]TBB57899.1 hypothetical protein ELH43_40560 [Rhizobium ruizarguesonis]TBF43770.1 hypothetical protein ELG90_36295 [Rhizobium leguminosarum]TBF85883.1 hypothetical protein ELG85_36835 [Rhizobium leguminosarum]TBG08043.1 hypothetical protein ELG79_36965 [Rhizobium leguminosarum]TBG35907.1 hypothetical protein ELG78_02395 [Rhizobium leguminosarum]
MIYINEKMTPVGALACEAASAIDTAGHLFQPDCLPDLSDPLSEILQRPLTATGRSYRFPGARARQLAATKERVTDRFGTLGAVLIQKMRSLPRQNVAFSWK